MDSPADAKRIADVIVEQAAEALVNEHLKKFLDGISSVDESGADGDVSDILHKHVHAFGSEIVRSSVRTATALLHGPAVENSQCVDDVFEDTALLMNALAEADADQSLIDLAVKIHSRVVTANNRRWARVHTHVANLVQHATHYTEISPTVARIMPAAQVLSLLRVPAYTAYCYFTFSGLIGFTLYDCVEGKFAGHNANDMKRVNPEKMRDHMQESLIPYRRWALEQQQLTLDHVIKHLPENYNMSQLCTALNNALREVMGGRFTTGNLGIV